MEAFLTFCFLVFFFSFYKQCSLWCRSYNPLIFHFGPKLFRERAGPARRKRRDVPFPSPLSYHPVAGTGVFNLWEGGREKLGLELGVQLHGNLQGTFSRVTFLVSVPRGKAVWLCTSVPRSGGVLRRACRVSNYRSHIDKFTTFHLIFLSQLWQSCENRIGEITKDFAVLHSFRTSIRAFE